MGRSVKTINPRVNEFWKMERHTKTARGRTGRLHGDGEIGVVKIGKRLGNVLRHLKKGMERERGEKFISERAREK
jgi:hypothetical protein